MSDADNLCIELCASCCSIFAICIPASLESWCNTKQYGMGWCDNCCGTTCCGMKADKGNQDDDDKRFADAPSTVAPNTTQQPQAQTDMTINPKATS